MQVWVILYDTSLSFPIVFKIPIFYFSIQEITVLRPIPLIGSNFIIHFIFSYSQSIPSFFWFLIVPHTHIRRKFVSGFLLFLKIPHFFLFTKFSGHLVFESNSKLFFLFVVKFLYWAWCPFVESQKIEKKNVFISSRARNPARPPVTVTRYSLLEAYRCTGCLLYHRFQRITNRHTIDINYPL